LFSFLKGEFIKMVLLFLHVIVALAFTVALVVLIALAEASEGED
jgi:hypothetical protein